MQGKNQCFNCGKEYNNKKQVPKILECNHIICLECCMRLYYPQEAITCPWCQHKTKIEPLELEIPFFPGEQELKTKECPKHKGQEKFLFCQEDNELICLVCANFGDQHKGHTIRDAQDILQNFQEKEFKKALEQKEASMELIDKYEDSLQVEQSKASENYERYVAAIAEKSEEIIIKVVKIKNLRVESLTKEWTEIQNKYKTQRQKIQELKRSIQISQPEDNQKLNDLINFVGKMEGIRKQVLNLRSFEIKVDFDQNIYKVLESLEELLEYRIIEKEISLQAKGLQVQEEFKNIRTIKRDSKTKISYSTINGQFTNEEQNIQPTYQNCTIIEQFQEDGLIISGGCSISPKRFLLNSQNQIQQFEMKNNRGYHRTNWDQQNLIIYIISGFSNNENVKECEVFNMNTQSFSSIDSIQTPVRYFGSALFDSDVYIFGGNCQNQQQNKLQHYQSKLNHWETCQQLLPTKSSTSAIFLQNQQSFLIYRNGDGDMDTYTFDLRQFIKHGQCHIGSEGGTDFAQPVQNQNFVYQFNVNSDLFRYDLASGNWSKV